VVGQARAVAAINGSKAVELKSRVLQAGEEAAMA
jgi:hypothetical protein